MRSLIHSLQTFPATLATPQSAAVIAGCDRSISTVHSWFRTGQNYRSPQPIDLRHMGLMDLLLEHWEDIQKNSEINCVHHSLEFS